MELELQEFLHAVNGIYGLYLDATTAFTKWHDQLVSAQKEIIARQGIPLEELDKIVFGYVENEEERDKGNWEYACTQKQAKDKNERGGDNHKLMANLCLILIYQYWEYNRHKLAERTGETVDSDFMGDIRFLRNSILKHRNTGNSEMKKCKILTYFKENELINISKDQFREIVGKIKEEVLELNRRYFV